MSTIQSIILHLVFLEEEEVNDAVYSSSNASNANNDAVVPSSEIELDELQNYIQKLHATELSIRSILLGHYRSARGNNTLQQITPVVLAMSADERENDSEGVEKVFFFQKDEGGNVTNEVRSDIEWMEDCHDHIGKTVYRPAVVNVDNMLNVNASTITCYWYKILAFSPSKEVDVDNDDVADCASVGRRTHFKAVGKVLLNLRKTPMNILSLLRPSLSGRYNTEPTALPISLQTMGTTDDLVMITTCKIVDPTKNCSFKYINKIINLVTEIDRWSIISIQLH